MKVTRQSYSFVGRLDIQPIIGGTSMKRFAPFAAAVAMACATAMQSGPGAATSPAITARDLRTRLYIFADDSMLGRQFGTEGNLKGTKYIANELARMGVQPGGSNGTYFQDVPAFRVAPVRSAEMLVDGTPLALGTDFITSFPPSGRGIIVDSLQVVYGGHLPESATLLKPE